MEKYTFHSLMTRSFNLKASETRYVDDEEEGARVSPYTIAEVIIPNIQRDYAQGRTDDDTKDIREKFVDSLFNALSDGTGDNRCSLNFIYGQLKARSEFGKVSFFPLDGQQRLTTLFLLHWYLSRLEEKSDRDSLRYLSSFRYEIRYSSSEFTTMFLRDITDLKLSADDVKWLNESKISAVVEWRKKSKINAVEGDIVPDGMLSKWLEDKPGFATSWLDDPTIAGMLTMLDEIHRKFRESASRGFLEKLTGNADDCPIYFYFKHILPTADDGDLFIKMNSRGKLLTEYEYFKADFQRLMKKANVSEAIRAETANNLDVKWMPSFWRLVRKYGALEPFGLKSSDLDDQMMRFVNYVIDVLCFTFRNEDHDGVVKPLFKAPCENRIKYYSKRLETLLVDDDGNLVEDRLKAFLAFLDIWTSNGDDMSGYRYFDETFCKQVNRQDGKIAVFASETNCQMLLSILAGVGSLKQESAVLFFAATWARIHGITGENASSRLRTARNLFHKMDKAEEDMPYVYNRIKILIETGKINAQLQASDAGSKFFTEAQVREETFKLSVASRDSAFLLKMRDLEESPWFMGSVAALLPDDYDSRSDLGSVSAVFARRKEAFEASFGGLGQHVPDKLVRGVLFWACRRPYCISASGSWYHWGTASGDFRWKGDTRPFLSRNDPSVRKALLAILDGNDIEELAKRQEPLRGEKLLEELLNRFRAAKPTPGPAETFDAAYYMTTYFDLFFEPWNTTLSNNNGRMKAVSDDGSLLAVNFYSGKNRQKDYWDPYLYVIWKLSANCDDVSGIVTSGADLDSVARFPNQDVFVKNKETCFDISGPRQLLDRLLADYPGMTIYDDADHPGRASASLPIQQQTMLPKADAEDRIQLGVALFEKISSMD